MRSGIVTTTLAATLLVTGLSVGAGAEPKTAAGLFYAKVTEGNWDPAGYQAFTAMVKKEGFKSSYAEEATYDKAPEILSDFAARGTDLIIAHSSGYASAVLDIAPKFPKTTFSVVSALASTNGLKNVNGWSFKWQELGFLAGAVAGLATKTDKVGVIAGDVIPAFTQAIAGYIEGVKYVNPKATVTVSWVGSFTDAAKAKQLTLAQISQGVDIVVPWADTAGLGVVEAARQEHIRTFGMYTDEKATAPDVIMTSPLLNFDKVYAELGSLYMSGKLEPKVYTLTVKDGYIGLAKLDLVTPEVVTKVNEIFDGIKTGKIKVSDADYKP
jgi:basic membrane lipoprotein Med (substrate-binding protein (PBP1-ABC) superfamily)